MQLLLPATVLSFMASTASAQYGGILFARGPGECPKHAQSDEEMTFSYAGGKFCEDVSQICKDDGNCGLGITSNLIGTVNKQPTTIGACSDSSCNDCETRDITDGGGTAWGYDCMHFADQTYLLLEE